MGQTERRKWFVVCIITVLFELLIHFQIILNNADIRFPKVIFGRGTIALAVSILLYCFFLRLRYGPTKELLKEKRFKI